MKIKQIPSFFILMLLIMLTLGGHARAGKSVKISGKVEAVDSSAHPQTFVVKTHEAKGKELTVGCRLDEKTIIKRGRKKGKLEDFKPGERVRLTYERVADGLICQTLEKS